MEKPGVGSKCVFLGTVAAVAASLSAFAAEPTARPPQFVALAFDGSKSIDMWEETRAFAKEMRALGTRFDFTYFVSGVYYLTSDKRKLYHPSGYGLGQSAIGFGRDEADILARVAQTNAAFDEGHEVASHANGHFDGRAWSHKQWSQEFGDFNNFIFNVFTNNALVSRPGDPTELKFDLNEMKGFRAPLLGAGPGLWSTLKGYEFRYDTSRVNRTDYWPQKMAGGYWDFPLAAVTIAGTGRRTLSMDYNFYFGDSGGKPESNPARWELYEKRMLETYLRYFESNYNGNRAPIHIGHHFSKWNGGAYWKAMKKFAKAVCGLPEVRCVTYRELANFMDKLDSDKLAAYRKGAFDKAKPIHPKYELGAPKSVLMQLGLGSAGELEARLSGKDSYGLSIHWEIDGQRVAKGAKLSLGGRDVTLSRQHRISAVATSGGVEIQRSTRDLNWNGGAPAISDSDLEDLALQGDLPEAHDEE